ncbi:MAG TPA: nicotinate phosphoribosyltransferase [Tepidisphaeraceae bacterium]|nr:nicotinate phosphoribosyltransferase [Tepidisphaeraceae bacterium]
MPLLRDLYRPTLGLLTDLYQLTMAYGYFKLGRHQREAVFQLTYRKNPFGGGFAVAAGLAYAIDYLETLRFGPADLSYLETLRGNDDRPLFDRPFLDHLAGMRFACDVDAAPEGTVVFPHEPLVRVSGPMLQAQIVETALLNMVNFQTLVATKAARVCLAARGEHVVEFGLRRAQGIDGGLAASRAAYVGGAHGTSNVLAGRLFGVPVAGTHAHSWVMSFDTELESFEAYARAMPNNCVFLVDTYNTLDGVRHAVEVGKRLRAGGHEMVGIRLDSGDLAYLSIEARKILDAGGFPKAKVLASNDLDENIIASLKDQGARIDTWGVGTKLVTAYDQPALGGVYKLAATRGGPADPWQYKVKLSEQAIKISTPGVQQVRRYLDGPAGAEATADMIYDVHHAPRGEATIVDPLDFSRRKRIPAGTPYEDLLAPIFRGGERVYDVPELAVSRKRTGEQLARFHGGVKRFVNPHTYPVGLEKSLYDLKARLILEARGVPAEPAGSWAPAGEGVATT